MDHHTEAFVGIDTPKSRNAIAIAEDERGARLYCVRNGRVARSRPALPTCRRAWSAWKPASVRIILAAS